jgi:hypothetical protein
MSRLVPEDNGMEEGGEHMHEATRLALTMNLAKMSFYREGCTIVLTF